MTSRKKPQPVILTEREKAAKVLTERRMAAGRDAYVASLNRGESQSQADAAYYQAYSEVK